MNPTQIRTIIFVAVVLALLLGSRTGAEFVIEYQWWQELGQVETWITLLMYRIFPVTVASLLCWPFLLWAHRSGTAFAGARTADYSIYSKLVPIALLVAASVFVGSSVDQQKVMAYMGSWGVALPADAWSDPVFGNHLPFYLFGVPFYTMLVRFVFATAVLSALVFWASGRGCRFLRRSSSSRPRAVRWRNLTPGRARCCS